MKLSEQCLRRWVNTDLSVHKIADQLTLIGLEVDTVTPVAAKFSGVLVGEVISTKQHPNADKLTCCEVSIGQESPLLIVCGAPNVRLGLKVAVATVGAVLPGDFKIKKAKLRGEPSFGMLCSPKELGLQFWQSTVDGIMELPSDAPIGMNFREYYAADDHVIDIEMTPNRGDCLSIRGVARDFAAATALELQESPIELVPAEEINSQIVSVPASEACPRYVGRVIKQIDNTMQTPFWIQKALMRAGIRPINLVVDVCNFVMIEIGQPMHAFDLDTVSGDMSVRYAKSGETCQLLDETDIELSSEDLVVADANQVLALAGVMGGLSSSVTEKSVSIFLEAAYFKKTSLCLSARRHNLSTDSSYRFERGVDSSLQVDAIERATAILVDVAGGVVAEINELSAENFLPNPQMILLKQGSIERILGMKVLSHQVVDSLERLGMAVTPVHSGWEVVAPTYRFDITYEVDLVEEIARMVGYDHIPTSVITAPLTMQPQTELQVSDEQLRMCLVERGYHEAITYSFIDPKMHGIFSENLEPIVLDNPLSKDLSVMRASLLPGLLQALEKNIRHQTPRVRLFETGLCFKRRNPGMSDLIQTAMFGMVATGGLYPEQWGSQQSPVDFYDMKADIEALLHISSRHMPISWQKASSDILHPGRSAELYLGDRYLGCLGELHPKVTQQLGLKQAPIVAEFNLHEIKQAAAPMFTPFSKLPAVRRDLAFVIDESVEASELTRLITKNSSELLRSVQVFDIYQGSGVEVGKKSVALGLTFQDPSRTLRDEEISVIIHGVVTMLEKELKATLRA